MAEEVYEKDGEVMEPVECPEERIVSVLTLHLGRVAIAQISRHDGSSLLLDTSSLATSLCLDQDYQQFQFRYRLAAATVSQVSVQVWPVRQELVGEFPLCSGLSGLQAEN